MAVNLRQNHFRFGRNTGTEAAHGWLGNEDANISFPTGVTFLLRIVAQEEGGTGINNVDFTWQYNLNGAGWNNITTTSSVVKSVANNCWANGADATQRLTGTGTFETSAAGLTADGSAGGGSNDIAASGCSETEISLQIVHADVANGDTIQFQIVSPDTTINNDVVPSLTVIKGAVAGWNYTAAGALTPAATASGDQTEFVLQKAGVLDFAGDFSVYQPEFARDKAGVLGFAGAYNRLADLIRQYGSELNLAGSYAYEKIRYSFNGIVSYVYTPAGAQPQSYDESRDGQLTSSGFLNRLSEKLRSYTSELSFVGSAQRLSQNLFDRTKDGVLTLIADVTAIVLRVYEESRSGILNSSGLVSRLAEKLRTYAGEATFSGIAQRLSQNLFARTKESVLSFSSDLTASLGKAYAETRDGLLTFAGSISQIVTARVVSVLEPEVAHGHGASEGKIRLERIGNDDRDIQDILMILGRVLNEV